MPDSISNALNEAADLLETVGWTQYQMVEYKNGHPTSYCALGAIVMVEAALGIPQVEAHFARYLWRNGWGVSIAGFNDSPGRKQEEVIAALRGAAKEIRP